MTIPAIIMLSLTGINLLFAAHLHGTKRPDYNFWVTAIGAALTIGLLYWGGFFN